jgi:hypothetical protein
LTAEAFAARFVSVLEAVESLFDTYARLYSDGDLQGVVSLCVTPFLSIRRGEVIHMPDRRSLLTHFTAAIDANRRATGAERWTRLELDIRQLGEYSVFATVHWNAVDRNEQIVRDTRTSYQLLATPDGWRFVSYTNHF